MGGPGSGRRPYGTAQKNWGGKAGTGPKGDTIKFGGTPAVRPGGIGRLGPAKAQHVGATKARIGRKVFVQKAGTRSGTRMVTKKFGGSKEWRKRVATMLKSRPKSMRKMLLAHFKATK